MAKGPPKSLAAAAKCTSTTGAIGLATWGVYGLEHAQKFEGTVRTFGAWACLGALVVGVGLAVVLTLKASIVSLFKTGPG